MPSEAVFSTSYARRIPDPNFKDIERHFWLVPVSDFPSNLPSDPNLRPPNTNRRVYQDVGRSLMNEEGESGTFHLKHKGITLIAESVAQQGDHRYVVTFGVGHGILDGGHTYKLLLEHLGDDDLPENQFVKVEILTGVPHEWVAEIAGGLNTSVQVQQMSLAHLEGQFNWIKDELRFEPYFKDIAWRENEGGEVDARDIVAILTCFNMYEFPNDRAGDHPVETYSRKKGALDRFERNPESYKKLRPILKDILVLHDTIRHDSRELWNTAGGKFGGLSWVEKKKSGVFQFPFTGQTGEYRLFAGALYPLLAAFRWMVEHDAETGLARWKGGFQEVQALWSACAQELLTMTHQASDELGRNPNALGKSKNHWANLHARVVMRYLMAASETAEPTVLTLASQE